MYYDNQNPFGRDSYRDMMCKEAGRVFSRFHFGIVVYVVSAYVITILADVILALFFKDSYAAIAENIYYQWVMGVFPMYLVGLPLLYLTVRTMPTRTLTKTKMPLGEFLIFFAIAQALMFIGNSIGTTLNEFFAVIKGDEISNSTSELIEESPVWITVLVAVIIGPIIEEFIFRKLLIDRLNQYGTVITVFVSGFSFGLFHGNFYQFFYATLLGILLAYITVKTGNWLYSVIMHIVINFFGSVAVLPIIELSEKLTAELEGLAAGEAVDAVGILTSALAVISYAVFEYGLVISGLVLLFLAFKNKWYILRSTAEINIPREDYFRVVFSNAGTIVFILLSVALFAISIFLG